MLNIEYSFLNAFVRGKEIPFSAAVAHKASETKRPFEKNVEITCRRFDSPLRMQPSLFGKLQVRDLILPSRAAAEGYYCS